MPTLCQYKTQVNKTTPKKSHIGMGTQIFPDYKKSMVYIFSL